MLLLPLYISHSVVQAFGVSQSSQNNMCPLIFNASAKLYKLLSVIFFSAYNSANSGSGAGLRKAPKKGHEVIRTRTHLGQGYAATSFGHGCTDMSFPHQTRPFSRHSVLALFATALPLLLSGRLQDDRRRLRFFAAIIMLIAYTFFAIMAATTSGTGSRIMYPAQFTLIVGSLLGVAAVKEAFCQSSLAKTSPVLITQ